jgi:hypothetical protein
VPFLQLAHEAAQRAILVVEGELAGHLQRLRLHDAIEGSLQQQHELVLTRWVQHLQQPTVLADELLEHPGEVLLRLLHLAAHHAGDLAIVAREAADALGEHTVSWREVHLERAGDSLFKPGPP